MSDTSDIVGVGVDTIKINVKLLDNEGQPSFDQTLPDEDISFLQLWQERALAQGQPVETTFSFHGARLVMFPNGASSWKYILRNDCIEVKIVPRLNMPMVAKITLQSSYLWEMGNSKETIDETSTFLCETFGSHLFLQAAQIDLCVDFVGLDLPAEWEQLFVCLARKKRAISDSQKDQSHYKGRKLQTILLSGHGCPVSFKLYDKIAEIKQHNDEKSWFYPRWKEKGWNGKEKVWRAEFSLEREGLNQMDLQGIYETIRNIKRIWAYCTQEWLRMVQPEQTQNRARWGTHPLWKCLQRAFDDYGDKELDGLGPLVRQRRREKNFERGVAAIAGYITTLAAWYEQETEKKTDDIDLFALVKQEVTARWEKLHIEPEEIIRLKKFIYSRTP